MTSKILLPVALLFLAGSVQAADPSAAEAKLRESLRTTKLELRTMQTQRDNLEITKTESEQKAEALAAELETVRTARAAEKEAAEKAVSELTAKKTAQEAEIASLKSSLEEWQAAHKKVTDLATAKEAERVKLAALSATLQHRVADQSTRNLAMFKIGNEILTRYEKFGLGTALTAREPFVGTMRVKLENLVQDYSDKLAAQRIKP